MLAGRLPATAWARSINVPILLASGPVAGSSPDRPLAPAGRLEGPISDAVLLIPLPESGSEA